MSMSAWVKSGQGESAHKRFQRCGQPGQQQGLRFPSLRLERPHSIRRVLVFGFLADSIQQIHSFRASGVMSSHVSNALASEVSAFFRSAGRSWTTPLRSSLRSKFGPQVYSSLHFSEPRSTGLGLPFRLSLFVLGNAGTLGIRLVSATPGSFRGNVSRAAPSRSRQRRSSSYPSSLRKRALLHLRRPPAPRSARAV
jgi:hypothetical protein